MVNTKITFGQENLNLLLGNGERTKNKYHAIAWNFVQKTSIYLVCIYIWLSSIFYSIAIYIHYIIQNLMIIVYYTVQLCRKFKIYLEFCFLESSGIKRTIIIASAKHNALALIYLSFKVVKNVVKMTLKSTALSAWKLSDKSLLFNLEEF